MGSELDAIILEMRPGFDFPSKHEHDSTQKPEKNDKAEESPTESSADVEDAPDAPVEEPSDDHEGDDKG